MSQARNDTVLYIQAQTDFRSQVEKWTEGISHFSLVPSPPLLTLAESPPADLIPCLILLDGRQEGAVTLEWAQNLKMIFQCPMIVFYDSQWPLNFMELKKNGADILLHFYYDAEFVVDKILELAPWSGDGPPPLSVLNPISLEDISSEVHLSFDLFIHLPGNQKTVLVRRVGDQVDDKIIHKAREAKQNLYFKKSELNQFLEYARHSSKKNDSPRTTSFTDRIIRSRNHIQKIITTFSDQSSTDFQVGRSILESCEKIIKDFGITDWKNHDDVLNALTFFSGRQRSYYNDAIALCVLSAGFGSLTKKPQEIVLDLALAGLLHNVGLASLENPQLAPNLENLSDEEKKQYQFYPEKSVQQIKGKRVPLSPRVTDLILQHRESASGQGFPHKTLAEDHDPNSRIIQLAFVVMEQTQLQKDKPANTLTATLQKLEEDALSGRSAHDATTILALKKAING